MSNFKEHSNDVEQESDYNIDNLVKLEDNLKIESIQSENKATKPHILSGKYQAFKLISTNRHQGVLDDWKAIQKMHPAKNCCQVM